MKVKYKYKSTVIILIALVFGMIIARTYSIGLFKCVCIVSDIYICCMISYFVRHTRGKKYNWYIIILSIGLWVIADIRFEIYSLQGLDYYVQLKKMLVLYLPTIVVIMIAAFAFMLRHAKKWNKKQLYIDVALSILFVFGMGYALFFSKMELMRFEMGGRFIAIVFVICNMLTVIAFITVLISIRLKQAWRYLIWIVISYLFFISANIGYLQDLFNERIIGNGVPGIMIQISFALLMITAYSRYHNHVNIFKIDNQETPDNFGRYKYMLILFVFPAVGTLIGYINIYYMLVFLVLFLLYLLITFYYQRNYATKKLLEQEHRMMKELEEQIIERTQSLEVANRELAHMTVTDEMTGLNNRRSFMRDIHKNIDNNLEFSIILIEIDEFSIVNSLYGYTVGDKTVIEIANKINGLTTDQLSVYMLRGEQVAIIIKEAKYSELEVKIQEIMGLINMKICINQLIFSVGATIGIARYPIDSSTSEELLNCATMALHHTKTRGVLEKYMFYNPYFCEKYKRENKVIMLLKEAVLDDEFMLYFQPQFSLDGEEMVGMEALLRWKHPTEGFISPNEFIPIAEKTDTIIEISYWVIKKAMMQIKKWKDKYGRKDLVMGINLSPNLLNDFCFFRRINELLEETGVSERQIDLEITEYSAINSSVVSEEILNKLSDMGFNMSIDDFGTGFASLCYLKRFDANRLKIAKELIDNIEHDDGELNIVKAIIIMSRGLGMSVIAEGVETKGQYKLLRNLGCDQIQGFLLGRPVPPYEFEERYFDNGFVDEYGV